MKKQLLNLGWKITKGNTPLVLSFQNEPDFKEVILPHDAMIHEDRTPDTANGTQTGFYPGGIYTYVKEIMVPTEWKEKSIVVEFEGAFETTMVYVNDELAETNLYGYSGFQVVLDDYLEYGKVNTVRVLVNNDTEKNCRWYSGSGLYRNVNLYIGEYIHIVPDGVKITTPSVSKEYAVVNICTKLCNISRMREKVKVEVTLTHKGKVVGQDIVEVTMFQNDQETVYQSIGIENAELWSPETPELYDCRVRILGNEELDVVNEHFGIRRLELDPKHGLRINGEPVKLRGACIHHDNGILGAASYDCAEDRKCRKLKEAGFNSIRSAHHPISKAMLNACDKYGVLVMDELTDVWGNHKNPNDYAIHFQKSMYTELERMVKKDYNHPSVIIYCIGNEIHDLEKARGSKWNRELNDAVHCLDPYRYTINAVNGIMTLGSRLNAVFEDMIKNNEAIAGEMNSNAGNGEGVNAMNAMMSLLTGDLAEEFACHPLMTESLKEACEGTDMIGLNYLSERHEIEKKIHPNKTVVGTESYPADIVNLWKIVEENNHVLGDYTWTGYDYLGEAGCGIFYYDGTRNFAGKYPDRASYIGDINLIGYRRPISYLREIVYGLRHDPYIAVERVDKYGQKHSTTAWMIKDNIASWTWHGYESRPANVDVYSDAEEVELFLNGKSLGRKEAGKSQGYISSYELTYEPGELVAVNYNHGKESGKCFLKTANENVELQIECENTRLKADSQDLAFITVCMVDEYGTVNLNLEKDIAVEVDGAGELLAFGSANPSSSGGYSDTIWKTFDGYVMAVIRAGSDKGEIKVGFSTTDGKKAGITIYVE